MTQTHPLLKPPSFLDWFLERMPALSVETIQKWMKNPEALERALESALACPPDLHEGDYPSIKVTIGTGSDVASLKGALVRGEFYIGDWARDLLDKLTYPLTTEKREVGLVIRSVTELGFEAGAAYKDICAKAKEMGLGLCSIETALQLRLQYLEQPRDEWFIVATEPVKNSRGYPSLFYVGHGNDGLALSADYGYPRTAFSLLHRFAFVLPAVRVVPLRSSGVGQRRNLSKPVVLRTSATPGTRSKTGRRSSREMYFATYQSIAEDDNRPGLFREYWRRAPEPTSKTSRRAFRQS